MSADAVTTLHTLVRSQERSDKRRDAKVEAALAQLRAANRALHVAAGDRLDLSLVAYTIASLLSVGPPFTIRHVKWSFGALGGASGLVVRRAR